MVSVWFAAIRKIQKKISFFFIIWCVFITFVAFYNWFVRRQHGLIRKNNNKLITDLLCIHIFFYQTRQSTVAHWCRSGRCKHFVCFVLFCYFGIHFWSIFHLRKVCHIFVKFFCFICSFLVKSKIKRNYWRKIWIIKYGIDVCDTQTLCLTCFMFSFLVVAFLASLLTL